jgi:hypothetical protein
MSSAPAPIFAAGPVGFVLPGGFDLSIDLDFLTGWVRESSLSKQIGYIELEHRTNIGGLVRLP